MHLQDARAIEWGGEPLLFLAAWESTKIQWMHMLRVRAGGQIDDFRMQVDRRSLPPLRPWLRQFTLADEQRGVHAEAHARANAQLAFGVSALRDGRDGRGVAPRWAGQHPVELRRAFGLLASREAARGHVADREDGGLVARLHHLHAVLL